MAAGVGGEKLCLGIDRFFINQYIRWHKSDAWRHTLADIPILVNSNGPPWLPAAAVQGRQFAYWGQVALLFMALILLIVGLANMFGGAYPSGVYALVAAAVNGLIFFLMPQTVFEPLDQGRFREASDRLLIWGILTLIFGVVGGLFLLIAFVQLQEVFRPQYQQYPPGQYYQQPQYQQPQYQPPYRPAQPPAPAPPPQQPTAPMAPPPAPARADMVKCRNCGAQYPAFMRNCPNCGAPRS